MKKVESTVGDDELNGILQRSKPEGILYLSQWNVHKEFVAKTDKQLGSASGFTRSSPFQMKLRVIIGLQIVADMFETIVRYGMDPRLELHRLLEVKDQKEYQEKGLYFNDTMRACLM